MNKIFTKTLLLLFVLIIQMQVNAAVTDEQIIKYLCKLKSKDIKQTKENEAILVENFKNVENNYQSNNLDKQQRLHIYSILLTDIGLQGADAINLKTILLYQIEQYDLQNPDKPLYKIYKTERFLFEDFINRTGNTIITEKIALHRTPEEIAEDIELAKYNAYRISRQPTELQRKKAIDDVFVDYENKGILLSEYKEIVLLSFDL
jgi:hypothetical protein